MSAYIKINDLWLQQISCSSLRRRLKGFQMFILVNSNIFFVVNLPKLSWIKVLIASIHQYGICPHWPPRLPADEMVSNRSELQQDEYNSQEQSVSSVVRSSLVSLVGRPSCAICSKTLSPDLKAARILRTRGLEHPRAREISESESPDAMRTTIAARCWSRELGIDIGVREQRWSGI
jgi:hypothetical protein